MSVGGITTILCLYITNLYQETINEKVNYFKFLYIIQNKLAIFELFFGLSIGIGANIGKFFYIQYGY